MCAVRLLGQCLLPDFKRFILLPHCPQYLSEVSSHFGVGERRVGCSQIGQGSIQAAEFVLNPAQAVDDGGVVRCYVDGALYQFQRFLITIGAHGQGITQVVERASVVRRQLDYMPQILLCLGQVVLLFAQQRPRKEQVDIIRILCQRGIQCDRGPL